MGYGNTRQRNGAGQNRVYSLEELRRVGTDLVILIHQRKPADEDLPSRIQVSRIHGEHVDGQRAWIGLDDPRLAEAIGAVPIPSGPVRLTLPEDDAGPVRAEVLPNTLAPRGMPTADMAFLSLMHARKVRRRYEQATGEPLDAITKELAATGLIGLYRDGQPFMGPYEAARLLSYEEMVKSGTEKPMVELEADRQRQAAEGDEDDMDD